MKNLNYVRALQCFRYDFGFANNEFKHLNKEEHKYIIKYLITTT